MVEQLVTTLEQSGQLENTYVVFTSDNGFHMGEHRLSPMKQTVYEEDIRVPLVVRGPGVPEGAKMMHLVLNNDLAPTLASWGEAKAPRFIDGRSLAPLFTESPPAPSEWRTALLARSGAIAP